MQRRFRYLRSFRRRRLASPPQTRDGSDVRRPVPRFLEWGVSAHDQYDLFQLGGGSDSRLVVVHTGSHHFRSEFYSPARWSHGHVDFIGRLQSRYSLTQFVEELGQRQSERTSELGRRIDGQAHFLIFQSPDVPLR